MKQTYHPTTAATELPDLPLMLKCKQVAELLNLSEKHIRDLCAEGKLNALHAGRAWRIPRATVLAMLNGEMEAANV